ncbi:MAG: hypothetical protein FJ276_06545 [Planctomycetes bacterium]|nr:hypothetical protein [Planctomycetota bacterium]
MKGRTTTNLRHADHFSNGVRYWTCLDEGAHHPDELVTLDWSLGRPARDRAGRLCRVIDVPNSRTRVAEFDCEAALREPLPLVVSDACSPGAGFECDGIDVDGAMYESTKWRAARWERSPSLNRLRGYIPLASIRKPCPAFLEYVLRLNEDIRFARVGCLGDGTVALQAVLFHQDQAWLRSARNALKVLLEILGPQARWWIHTELVADLLDQAGL